MHPGQGQPAVLALIPARGGSRSIERKNILPVAGRPLLAYTVDHALASRLISRVIVSTDDDEIAAVAREAGAEVPFIRPAELATDDALDLGVFDHALRWLRQHDSYRPELVVHLRATNPVRDPSLIDRAIDEMLGDPGADALRSVSECQQSPYGMWRLERDRLEPLLPGVDPEPAYWQNGYVDIVRPRTILELKSMVGRRVRPFVVEAPIVELDYPDQIQALERALGAKGR